MGVVSAPQRACWPPEVKYFSTFYVLPTPLNRKPVQRLIIMTRCYCGFAMLPLLFRMRNVPMGFPGNINCLFASHRSESNHHLSRKKGNVIHAIRRLQLFGHVARCGTEQDHARIGSPLRNWNRPIGRPRQT